MLLSAAARLQAKPFYHRKEFNKLIKIDSVYSQNFLRDIKLFEQNLEKIENIIHKNIKVVFNEIQLLLTFQFRAIVHHIWEK